MDFSKMVQGAKAKVAADRAAEAAREEAAKQAEIERIAAARTFLVTQVQPILEQAKAAFSEQGIDLVIKDGATLSHEGNSRPIWAMTASCNKITSSVHMPSKKTRRDSIRFEHDGKYLVITKSWCYAYDNRVRGDMPEIAEAAIASLIEQYYEVEGS